MRTYLTAFLCLSTVLSCGKKDSKNSNPPPTNQPPPAQNEGNEKQFQSKVYATSADLPDCDAKLSGALAYVLVTKTFQTCDETTWVPVEIGNKKESTIGSGLELFDAENNKVANLLGPYVKSNIAYYDVHLLDGVTIPIDGNKLGKNFFEDGSLPIDICYYTTSDCSGMCYAGASVYTDVVTDTLGQFRQKIKEVPSTRTMLSFASNPTGFKHSIMCLNIGGGGNPLSTVSTNPYTPIQFKYPFALPLSVR